jgi:hypothetical protein
MDLECSKQEGTSLTWLKIGQKWAEPVRKPILDIGQFAEVKPGIFWRIFSQLGLEAA